MLIASLIFSAQIKTSEAVIILAVPSAIGWVVGATSVESTISAAAIGTVIAGIGWYAANTPAPSSKAQLPLYIPFNPRDPLVPPSSSGWSPATPAQAAAGDVNPNPPYTTAPTYVSVPPYYTSNGYGPFATFDLAMQRISGSSYATTHVYPPPKSTIDRSIGLGLVRKFTFDIVGLDGLNYTSSNGIYIYSSESLSCPAGYTYSATPTSTCLLTTKASVDYPVTNIAPVLTFFDGVKNGTCEIKRTGNTYATNSRDQDCANGSPSLLAAANGGSVVVSPNNITSISEDGKKVTVVMNADGSQTVTTSVPDNATNTTQIDTFNISAPNALDGQTKLTGKSSAVVQGVGTAAAAVPTQQVEVKFPKDYARAGESQAAAVPLVLGLDQIHKDLTPSDIPVTANPLDVAFIDVATTGLASRVADMENGFPNDPVPPPTAGLSNFFMTPFQPVACQPLSFTFATKTIAYDICPWVETIKNVGGFAVYLLTASIMFGMITRRPEGE